ncbi:hypothetical protein BKA23_3538 [Rudaeicoccus suwonensis]|uniref:Uncharacterized protein n=1 Tax=Rudaeicoccus suwonensis TaxID=657409 RepID=A0A561DU56_9MICO|nr:hypothetical protein BKA23_3538 [Rudaeicoccus suwonensis]
MRGRHASSSSTSGARTGKDAEARTPPRRTWKWRDDALSWHQVSLSEPDNDTWCQLNARGGTLDVSQFDQFSLLAPNVSVAVCD